MTRFQQEISGQLGENWKKSAEREVEQAKNWFEEKAYVVDGIFRCKSNDRIPFDDMLEKMEYAGCQFDREASSLTRDEEVKIEIAKLRSKPAVHSEAEMREMRAAFGVGATVVDILTGEKIKL